MTRLLLVLLCAIPYAGCNGCWDQTAYAGGCYSQAISYAQPLYVKAYAAPVVSYYYVGGSIRAAAVVEAEKRADPDYQDFLDFKAWKAGQQTRAPESPVPDGALPQRQSLIESRCVRCHNPNSPNGPGGGYDFSGPLTAADLKAIKEILPTGKMPKVGSPEAKDFSNELAGALILEAIDKLSDATDAPEPPANLTEEYHDESIPPPPPLPPTEQ